MSHGYQTNPYKRGGICLTK